MRRRKFAGWLATAAACAAVGLLAVSCDESAISGGDAGDAASWAMVEIDGIVSAGPYLILSGPGYDIERIAGFDSVGQPDDTPGLATEHDFVFEAEPADARDLMTYFDRYRADPGGTASKNASIVVLRLDRSEAFRWNLLDFVPAGTYEAGDEGRTRFTMRHARPPDLTPGWDTPGGTDPFGSSTSYNPQTDTRVEIDGIVTFYFEVEENAADRTLTLTYDFQEGNGFWTWTRHIVRGTADLRNMSVIQTDSEGAEVSRRNYLGCFPIRYEQCTGFDLDIKAKGRAVLSFNRSEDS